MDIVLSILGGCSLMSFLTAWFLVVSMGTSGSYIEEIKNAGWKVQLWGWLSLVMLVGGLLL